MSVRQNLARIAEIDESNLDKAISLAQKIFGFDDESTEFALNSDNLKDKTNYLKVVANDTEENLIEEFFMKVAKLNGKSAPARGKAAPAPTRKVAPAPTRKVAAAAPARQTRQAPARQAAAAPAGGTKKEQALRLLGRASGASIDQIADKLEITPKAAHGILYFLRRDGHNIENVERGVFQLVAKTQRRAAAGAR